MEQDTAAAGLRQTATESVSRAPPLTLRDLEVSEHLGDPAKKQRYVTRLFDIAAPSYDRFTSTFSLGMDARWKRELLALAAARTPPGAVVLDLASGTGDLALAAARFASGPRVLGVDISRRMVAVAETRRRAADGPGARFAAGDLLSLAVPDRSVDVVTVGYGLRNTPGYQRGLNEIARVLKPGGWLLCLDFYRPASRLWRTLFFAYLTWCGNLLGWLWHAEPAVYGYVVRSVAQYLSWREFSAALEQRGFAVQDARPKLRGGICIHVARLRELQPPQAGEARER